MTSRTVLRSRRGKLFVLFGTEDLVPKRLRGSTCHAQCRVDTKFAESAEIAKSFRLRRCHSGQIAARLGLDFSGNLWYTHPCTHYNPVERLSSMLSRVFMNGNSQAVRIPQEYRLETNQVEISRNENGELIIRPISSDRGEAILQALSAFDDEFVNDLELGQSEQLEPQEREEL